MKPKEEIIITMHGGLVDTVLCSTRANVRVLDFDVQGLDTDELQQIALANGEKREAYVYDTTASVNLRAIRRHLRKRSDPVNLPPNHRLDARELGTVLAALRFWQATIKNGDGSRIGEELNAIATNVWTQRALTLKQIDALCERLNGGA